MAAGMQALPVGKIIDDKGCRKDNQKGIANLHMLKDIWKTSTIECKEIQWKYECSLIFPTFP